MSKSNFAKMKSEVSDCRKCTSQSFFKKIIIPFLINDIKNKDVVYNFTLNLEYIRELYKI